MNFISSSECDIKYKEGNDHLKIFLSCATLAHSKFEKMSRHSIYGMKQKMKIEKANVSVSHAFTGRIVSNSLCFTRFNFFSLSNI